MARRRPEILTEARAGHQHLPGMVPQIHAPVEEAVVDFCEAYAVIAGNSMKCYLFTLRLRSSGRMANSPESAPAASSWRRGGA